MTKAASFGHSRSGSGGGIRHTYIRDLLTSSLFFILLVVVFSVVVVVVFLFLSVFLFCLCHKIIFNGLNVFLALQIIHVRFRGSSL